MSKRSPRRLAYEALLLQQRGSYANLALKEALGGEKGLKPQDRAFATALFYSALEHFLSLEYYFRQLARGGRIALPLRCVLALGGTQLLYMDVPARAAVDESVKLCKEIGKGANTSFVNALLRELDRRRERLPEPEGSVAQRLSIRYSYPLWLVERLLALLGEEEAGSFMAGGHLSPGVCVRANPAKMNSSALDEALAARGIPFAPGCLAEEARYLQYRGDIGELDLFAQGALAVQGESSMLAGRMAGARKGMKALDACAAPGGKTAYMAGSMGEGELLAWDIHPHRVELIRRNCQRLGLPWVQAECQDARIFCPQWEGHFDLALVDAPCSGLGVLEDKPDIKYAREPTELAELLPLQQEILGNCARYVKPGGALLYVTCTILPEENGEQVETFLREHEGFQREGEALQLWPQRDGVSGFYMARMRRCE